MKREKLSAMEGVELFKEVSIKVKVDRVVASL